MKNNQKGFSAVEAIVVIVIVVLLGVIGWLVYDRNHNKPAKTANTQTTQKTDTKQDTTKPDPNAGYLVVKEWGLRFKTPSGLADVRYAIHNDTDDKLAFFAKPADSNVQYTKDYDAYANGNFTYATGVLFRSTEATKNLNDTTIAGKKLGNYYYYTNWAFSGLATGAGCHALYGDSSDASCQLELKAFNLVNKGDTALLNTIELAQ